MYFIINSVSPVPVKAETIINTKENTYNVATASLDNNNQAILTTDNKTDKNERIDEINNEIKENYHTILQLEENMNNIKTEISQLENEISVIQDNINNRNEILKERVRSFQHTGGNISYLEVLINSKDFGEFVDRVNSVTKIVQADQDLIDQQNVEMKELENKQSSLTAKYNELTNKKSEYDKLMAYLHEQSVSAASNLSESQNQETKPHNATDMEASHAMGHGYINTIITSGYKYIGNSVYVFGGGRTEADIANGRFDCSGFVNWAFSQAGIEIGSTTDSIKNDGRSISEDKMQPGDLVFFDTYKKDGHVGIYIGNGKFIGSQSSTGVAIADMTDGYWKEKFNGRIIRIVE